MTLGRTLVVVVVVVVVRGMRACPCSVNVHGDLNTDESAIFFLCV